MGRCTFLIPFSVLLLSFATVSGPSSRPRKPVENRYAVIIGGIGGEAAYSERYRTWVRGLYRALHEKHGLPRDHLFALVEDPSKTEDIPARKSTLKGITALFASLSRRLAPNDVLFVLMVGHGSATGAEARFNIPGPDLTASGLNELLSPFKAARIVVVDGTSASAPFIDALSGPRRVIITATKSGREHHATLFPAHFLAALSTGKSDLDKDGRVSMLEAFTYARKQTAVWYENKGLLATEHPLLDDNGDHVGSRDPGGTDADGRLARMITFGTPIEEGEPLRLSGEARARLEALEVRSADIQRRIEALKLDKPDVPGAEYTSRMQALLLELARVGSEMRRLKGASSER